MRQILEAHKRALALEAARQEEEERKAALIAYVALCACVYVFVPFVSARGRANVHAPESGESVTCAFHVVSSPPPPRKQEAAAEIQRKVQADKERELQLRRERRHLIESGKQDKVERQKRKEEFERTLMLGKIQEKMERAEVRDSNF